LLFGIFIFFTLSFAIITRWEFVFLAGDAGWVDGDLIATIAASVLLWLFGVGIMVY
jgi:hypothetical protein